MKLNFTTGFDFLISNSNCSLDSSESDQPNDCYKEIIQKLDTLADHGSQNSSEVLVQDWLIQTPTVLYLFLMAYVIIFFVGVGGNLLVCWIVVRNNHMRTVTNYFIMNLAMSDILLCVFCLPFTPLYYYFQSWLFGSILCHLLTFAQGTSIYVSTLTLTAIAIDRYLVIVHPFKPRMKISTCFSIVLVVWIVGSLFISPYAYFTIHEKIEGSYYCQEDWSHERGRQVFGTITFIAQFLIPFIVIAVSYVRLSIHLNDRAKVKIGARSSKREEKERERKKRTNRMLVAMVIVFGVSWLPMMATNIVNDFVPTAAHWIYFNFR